MGFVVTSGIPLTTGFQTNAPRLLDAYGAVQCRNDLHLPTEEQSYNDTPTTPGVFKWIYRCAGRTVFVVNEQREYWLPDPDDLTDSGWRVKGSSIDATRLDGLINQLCEDTKRSAMAGQEETVFRDIIDTATGGSTITFGPEFNDAVIELESGEIAIDKNLTIDATGQNITLDANHLSRIFNIAAAKTVTIKGLRMKRGQSAGNGGAIYNVGHLTLIDCVIEDSEALSGGGIYNNIGGTLTVTNCTIANNTASVFGGGIHSSYMLIVTNCTIVGNSASSQGGGINNGDSALMVTNSTISGNSANSGGGIHSYGGVWTVTDCTITGNSAEQGGGIYNAYGTVTIENSQIKNNAASQRYGGIGNAGDLEITDTMISSNKASTNGGGLGNNGGTVTFDGEVTFKLNQSTDGNHHIWNNNGTLNGSYTII